MPHTHTMHTIVVYLSLSLIITNFIWIASAFDAFPRQDFCVADPKSTQTINGVHYPCKDPKFVTANDFYYTGLNKFANTFNPFKAGLTKVDVNAVPGLNTLGLTMARRDFEQGGFYPLHLHPRASELLIVIQGQVEFGFVSPDQGYKYYKKELKAGDMFVVPPGLIHAGRNIGKGKASLYVILNSQNPGNVIVSQGVFGANPAIDANYLADGYQLDVKTIKMLQSKRWPI